MTGNRSVTQPAQLGETVSALLGPDGIGSEAATDDGDFEEFSI